MNATFDHAANAAYDDILDEPFTLTNGRYEGEPFVEDASSKPIVQIDTEHSATGDLDDDELNEIVVALVTNFGGSGAYVYLAVVDTTEKGTRSVATTGLGDRVQIRSLAVENGLVVIETTEHGPDDAMCCPTVQRLREWNPATGSMTDPAASNNVSRFRGQVVLGHEVRSFTECDSGREGWLIDETGRDLGEVYRSLANEPYQPLYFEILGKWADRPDAGFAADFSEAIRVSEIRRAEREGFGCREDLSAWNFSARGNEPSWRVDLREPGLEFVSMGSDPITFSTSRTEKTSDGLRITANSSDSVIDLAIVEERCSDSMSGSVFPLTATVKFDEMTLKGCAAEGMRP
jgi:uncharacterized membrane protein